MSPHAQLKWLKHGQSLQRYSNLVAPFTCGPQALAFGRSGCGPVCGAAVAAAAVHQLAVFAYGFEHGGEAWRGVPCEADSQRDQRQVKDDRPAQQPLVGAEGFEPPTYAL